MIFCSIILISGEKDRFLYGCMAVTVSAVLLNVFTGCILPPPEVQIMANGGISYHYHAKTGIWLLAAAEIFLLVYVTRLPTKNRGTIRVSEKTRIIINRNTAHYGWKYSVRDAMER